MTTRTIHKLAIVQTKPARPVPGRRGLGLVFPPSCPVHRYRGPENTGTLSKVPEVTLIFWLIKICATTLGETGGDALSMTLQLGYAISSAIFFGIFLATVAAQVSARSFHRFRYWAVIVTTTTVGTTIWITSRALPGSVISSPRSCSSRSFFWCSASGILPSAPSR